MKGMVEMSGATTWSLAEKRFIIQPLLKRFLTLKGLEK
ncbi:hypothetical protein BAMA111019_13130 [Bacillus manliponensis]